MEVRRTLVVGVVTGLAWSSAALAQEGGSSSTAAFPDTAPRSDANAPSRAGFPTSTPAPKPTPAPTYQPYAAQPQPQQYPAPAASVPQNAYYAPGATQQGWGASPYGSNAAADGPSPSVQHPESNEKPTRYVSLTLSPIHLALPVLEATLEVRPTEHLGIAVVGGIGKAPPVVVGQTGAFFDNGERYAVKEIGGQLLFYPLSKFDGLVLGGEIQRVTVSGTTTVETQSVDVRGSALALGPLIGGKWIHESGFTLFGHLGVQRLWLQGESTAQGQTVSLSDNDTRKWWPLVNLNAGWSF